MVMDYNQTLTLRMIRDNHPDQDVWKQLLSGLGKTEADNDPLTIAEIYRIVGFDEAVCCLCLLPDDKLSRHFQAWCAERVLHVFEAERPGDMRVRAQIEMLRNDNASQEYRADVSAAAIIAAGATEGVAAWGAATAAVGIFAWDAAQTAARAAALASASTPETVERAAQEYQFRKMIGVGQ